jgi:multiple sugar transport system ATP-binding protein
MSISISIDAPPYSYACPARQSTLWTACVDVTEPTGMETLVFFRVNGTDVCARTNPAAGAQPGRPLKMLADLGHMHLIDDESGRVL